MANTNPRDPSVGQKAANLADRAADKVKSLFGHDDDDYYRTHHERSSGSTGGRHSYDQARPAYEFGHTAALDERFHQRSFDDAEPDLRQDYVRTAGQDNWNDVRDYARDAYGRGQERRLTLSEEQLAIGKRQVQAGEVELRKTVETENVRESVPLVHEEVSVERRPLSGTDATLDASSTAFGEETIRVPLMAEEAVIDKRVVATEEVVVRTNQVTENQVVEDTVRRERLVTDGLEGQQLRGQNLHGSAADLSSSGAQDRATNSGPLDRLADKLDDVKDRVDGNPASRPGPDATDRRI